MPNLSVPFLRREGWSKQGRAHALSLATSGSERTCSQLRWGKGRVPANIHQKDAIWDTKVLSEVKRETHSGSGWLQKYLFVCQSDDQVYRLSSLSYLSAHFKGAEGGKTGKSATFAEKHLMWGRQVIIGGSWVRPQKVYCGNEPSGGDKSRN